MLTHVIDIHAKQVGSYWIDTDEYKVDNLKSIIIHPIIQGLIKQNDIVLSINQTAL